MIGLDLSRSVYELTEEHPDLIPVLKELGFIGLANPILRATLGRRLTLPEGCRRQGKDLAEVLRALAERGYAAELPGEQAG